MNSTILQLKAASAGKVMVSVQPQVYATYVLQILAQQVFCQDAFAILATYGIPPLKDVKSSFASLTLHSPQAANVYAILASTSMDKNARELSPVPPDPLGIQRN